MQMKMELHFAILLFILMSIFMTGILFLKSHEIDIKRTSRNPTITTKLQDLEDARPTPVIILTYARSGSSFLGDIIRQAEEVFYVFEPLHFLDHHIHLDRLTFFNGTTRTSYQYSVLVNNIISSIFTCQLINLPLEFWHGKFVDMHGYQLQTFLTKFKSERSARYSKQMEFKIAIQILQLECIKSKVVVIKTIRASLFLVQGLFSQLERLKTLHLVRDPRPTIISQKIYINDFDSVSDYAANLCFRISNDISMSNLLTVLYPSSIVRIRYEILTTKPVDTSKNIYQFLNLTFTKRIKYVIWKKTSSGISGKGPLNTVKGNSTEMVNAWRLSANHSFVKSIDKKCQYLYKKLGYIQISDIAMLKNTSVALFLP